MRSDTTPAGSRDLPGIWEDTRRRIAELVEALDEDAVGTALATVPGATVRDALAHLAATADHAAESPAELYRGPLAPPHSGHGAAESTLCGLITAWDKAAAVVRGRLETDVELASFLITDAAMCEHDLRTTFQVAGARDDVAIKVALDELSGRFSDRAEAAGLPPLRVTVEQWGTIIGNGRAVSCVVADRFEFVRAMSGRRSGPEIRQWNWGVEPGTYLSAISEVGLPSREIHERDPRIPEHMRDREFVL